MTETIPYPANTSGSQLPPQPEEIQITQADVEEANTDTIAAAIYNDIDRIGGLITATTSSAEKKTYIQQKVEALSAESALRSWDEGQTFREFLAEANLAEGAPDWAGKAESWLDRSGHLIADVMRAKAQAETASDNRSQPDVEQHEEPADFLTPAQMVAARAALAGMNISSELSQPAVAKSGAEKQPDDPLAIKAEKMLRDVLTVPEQHALREAYNAANRQLLEERRQGIADGPAIHEIRRIREIQNNQQFETRNPDDILKMYELLGLTDAASKEDALERVVQFRDAQTRTPPGMISTCAVAFSRDAVTHKVEPGMGALSDILADRLTNGV